MDLNGERGNMEIIERKTTEIHPYEGNPRNNEAAIPAVMESIRQFGFKVPIIIDEKDVIIAGHTRLKAAERLGMETVPCIKADDLTPEQVKAFRIADNKTAELSTWDFEALNVGLSEIEDIDMSAFGFDIWRHEPILYGWKEGAAHYFIDDRSQDTVLLEDELDLQSMKKEDLITYINQIRANYKDRTTVLYEHKPAKNDLHPTMKPISLIGRLMKNSSKPDWNVLDLFGGSGSTLMAAEQLGRKCYMMEIDPHYCDVIIDRWEQYTGGKAELIDGNGRK